MGWGTGGHKGPNKPDKGHLNGSCNVTACQRDGAIMWNRAMHRYYCRECAAAGNADPVVSRDAERFYGVGQTLYVGPGHPKYGRQEYD
jgi:deoxycytidylate deaminase